MLNALFGVAYGLETPFFRQLAFLLACPWQIDTVASLERNVTHVTLVKTAEWDFR